MISDCSPSRDRYDLTRNLQRRNFVAVAACIIVVNCILSPIRVVSATTLPGQRILFSFQCMPHSCPATKSTVSRRSRFVESETTLAACEGNAMEDNLDRQLARARELLAKSKAKLQVQQTMRREEEEKLRQEQKSVPFFATIVPTSATVANGKKSVQITTDKRSIVTKTLDENSGLITTDGELMAKLSEDEQWERRSLWEVFDQTELLAESVREDMEKELHKNDATKKPRTSLNDRDVAANIYNLRRILQNEDYRQIFDPNNRFIGEDN